MLHELLSTAAAAAGACAGITFLVAAAAKLKDRAVLPAVIANYRLLPRGAVAPVAMLLPWVELALGIALLLGERPIAPVAGAALLIMFAVAMEINIRRGRAFIDCGCGLGELRQPLRRAFVARNLVLAGTMLPAALLDDALPPFARITAVCAGLVCFVLLLLLNALLALPAFDRQPA